MSEKMAKVMSRMREGDVSEQLTDYISEQK